MLSFSLIVLIVLPAILPSMYLIVRAEDSLPEDLQDLSLKNLALGSIVWAFSPIPPDQVEKYYLFHTVNISRANGNNYEFTVVSEPYLSGDEVLNLTKYSQDALNELLSNLDLLNSIFFDHNGTVLIHYNGSKVCRNYFNYTRQGTTFSKYHTLSLSRWQSTWLIAHMRTPIPR